MIIYKITNLINNKIYIGKKIIDKIDYFGSGILINRSIQKYGIENFKKEIIDEVLSIKELNEKEKYWIQYFNSNDLTIGYNISNGGDGGDVFTNNPNKEEIRKKCSKSSEKNGMFGRNHTKESIEKISKNRKGKRRGISTWNKGLKKEDYTSDQFEKMYSNRKNGPDCPSAVIYIFISPLNELFEIKGEYEKFCNLNEINYKISRHWIDKGIIQPPKKGKPTQNRINLIGWEIRSLKYHRTIETHSLQNM